MPYTCTLLASQILGDKEPQILEVTRHKTLKAAKEHQESAETALRANGYQRSTKFANGSEYKHADRSKRTIIISKEE